ncbi:MAG: rRNA maturation RNase YbeY [Bryobacteraceae bacterium]
MSPVDDCTVLFRALPKHLEFSSEQKRTLAAFARSLTRRVVDGRSFTCLITGDAELHRLNSAFLAHNYPTDVLSFPASNSEHSIGDIAISADRAEAQAVEFGHTRIDEIRILMLHGLLHLAGMDHEHDSGEMARAEERWRAELNLPDSLIARTGTVSGESLRDLSCATNRHLSK